MPVIKLMQQQILQLQPAPEGQKVQYCDSEVRGLLVEIRANAANATFYFRYKGTDKKTAYRRLGGVQDLTVAEARKMAAAVKVEIAAGRDFKAEKAAKEAELTFTQFFENHYLPYVKLRKRSWEKDSGMFCLRIKDAFGDKRLNQITRQQVQLFHTALRDQGLAGATCDHHVKLIKHALNLAVDWDFLETNPTKRVPLFNHFNMVEHNLDAAELERLLTVLRTDSNKMVCFVARFLLVTGARLNEALSAKWTDID